MDYGTEEELPLLLPFLVVNSCAPNKLLSLWCCCSDGREICWFGVVVLIGQLPLASGANPLVHVVCCDVDGGRAFVGGRGGDGKEEEGGGGRFFGGSGLGGLHDFSAFI